jgi:hypothetical protein
MSEPVEFAIEIALLNKATDFAAASSPSPSVHSIDVVERAQVRALQPAERGRLVMVTKPKRLMMSVLDFDAVILQKRGKFSANLRPLALQRRRARKFFVGPNRERGGLQGTSLERRGGGALCVAGRPCWLPPTGGLGWRRWWESRNRRDLQPRSRRAFGHHATRRAACAGAVGEVKGGRKTAR